MPPEEKISMRYRIANIFGVLTVAMALPLVLQAQGGGRGGPPPSARAVAPIDLTGYWVSIVDEDWRFRMVTPTPGDYQGVPMTAASKKVADACVLIPVVNSETITPHSEAFQAVVWHLIVTHPGLKQNAMKWESTR